MCVVVCMKDHQANKLSFFYSEIYIDPALKKERLVGLFEASAFSTISNFRKISILHKTATQLKKRATSILGP